MSSNTPKDLIAKGTSLFADLQNIKDKISPKLEGVQVKVDRNKNADLYNSIVAIFGERNVNNTDTDFITFDMYLECLRIIKLASKSTAKDFIEKRGI